MKRWMYLFLALALFRLSLNWGLSASIRVACVGDSITAGTPSSQSYVPDLQLLLGLGYSVTNCGTPGLAIVTNYGRGYLGTTADKTAIQSNPEIVVIVLGSNDSNSQYASYSNKVYSEYRALISHFSGASSHPQLLLATPPAIYTNTLNLENANLLGYVIPAIRQAASDFGLPLVDLYSATTNHSDWTVDGIHPNSMGALAIADAVFSALTNELKLSGTSAQDPAIQSFLTSISGRYARIYTNDAARLTGGASTTWDTGAGLSQSLPVYAGVQEVDFSSSWIYVRSADMAPYTMGPWYNETTHQSLILNWPVNQRQLFRIPRSPTVPATKTATGAGGVGIFVDGVAMDNSTDNHVWTGSGESGGGATGYWNRDAYVNEGAGFDPANAHANPMGQYHYHASPIALRHLLGDHVDFDKTTGNYSESTQPVTRHSPILGWVADGYPVYGPYGYSQATNPVSGLRRMISGYVLRNGQKGTSNLSLVGRTNLPAWAVRLYQVSAATTGPSVNSDYPLGRYMEDNEYLGDLGFVQGYDFDLDEYNGRFAVTPEYPEGTYAYFVSIDSEGRPVFPYNIGRGFYGNPTGGNVKSISETVITNFLGGPDLAPSLNPPKATNRTVTLVWSAVEGGTYQVDDSTNLTTWSARADRIIPVLDSASVALDRIADAEFYRVSRTGLASYDPSTNSSSTSGGSSGGIVSVFPSSAKPGDTVTMTISLNANANPPPPPVGIAVTQVTVGTWKATQATYSTKAVVTATVTIPASATPGLQTVVVTFPAPPGSSNSTVDFTLDNGFTVL